MNADTSSTFLDSLRGDDRTKAWNELNRIYQPMIKRWLQRANASVNDYDDLVQEVLMQVSQKVGGFVKASQVGAFRAWLKQITINCLRNYRRKKGNQNQSLGGQEFDFLINGLEDQNSALSAIWNEEHDAFVLRYLIKEAENSFSEKSFQAFYLSAIEGLSTPEIAAKLGMSVASVHTAKSRVLAELRRRGAGIWDEI